jgi:hypothetical protein
MARKPWVMTPARKAWYKSKKKSAGFKKAYSSAYKQARSMGVTKQFSKGMAMTAGREFKEDYERVRSASSRAFQRRWKGQPNKAKVKSYKVSGFGRVKRVTIPGS